MRKNLGRYGKEVLDLHWRCQKWGFVQFACGADSITAPDDDASEPEDENPSFISRLLALFN